ncbi:helix-turn-helix domain-containing protein [Streptomyces sp. G-G2]|uniref:helix-turn-helix domain-containing protein n=1 Tax=Streptomyces sp. G-G2 TaxID=3046201 RepID=UPI0024BA01B8|nr:helix-turn-helix domain-containing protein [Streptomyces sp. G-G2]MDJ0385324.1 helix-turn-helix domain-containing protein [Streptomyces sp. G-G2]
MSRAAALATATPGLSSSEHRALRPAGQQQVEGAEMEAFDVHGKALAEVAPQRAASGSVRRRPTAALRPYIANYIGFHTWFDAPRRRLELPTGFVSLVFTFTDGLWISRTEDPAAAPPRQASRAMVSGPRTVPAIGVHAGAVRGLEVNMSPLGAYRLFGLPMAYFEDAHVDLVDVLGATWQSLPDRLQQLDAWQERFALLDEVLCARLDGGPHPSPEVRGALWRLWTDGGSLSGVAAETGWSARTLRARFREQVGLSPKGVSRVFRMQHALRLMSAGTSLAQVAAVCGYHDQAHLSRDLKAMTGLAPSRFVKLRGGLPPGSVLDRVPGRISSVMLSG